MSEAKRETAGQALAEEQLQRELSAMQTSGNDNERAEAEAVHVLLTRLDLAVQVCQARFAEPVSADVVVAVAAALTAVRHSGQATF